MVMRGEGVASIVGELGKIRVNRSDSAANEKESSSRSI